MFAHIKKILLHLPKLQCLFSFLPELAAFQIFMEGIKAQHSSVTFPVSAITKLMKTGGGDRLQVSTFSEVSGELRSAIHCICCSG
jgi:hypothetical protein